MIQYLSCIFMGDIKLFILTMFYSLCEVLFRLTAIQSLLTLLGSCFCSPYHRHVASVHHGDGSVECHPFAAPAPATTLLRWKLFPHDTKPILKIKVNKLRIGQIVQYVVYFVRHGKWLFINRPGIAGAVLQTPP